MKVGIFFLVVYVVGLWWYRDQIYASGGGAFRALDVQDA